MPVGTNPSIRAAGELRARRALQPRKRGLSERGEACGFESQGAALCSLSRTCSGAMESPSTPLAMSMAARKSSASFGSWRDSFYATPLDASSLGDSSGPVFSVLEFTSIDDVIPEVIVTANPEDPELLGYSGKSVSQIVTASTSMIAQLESHFSEAKEQVEALTINVKTKEGVDANVSKHSQQAVCDAFFNALTTKAPEILTSAVEEYVEKIVVPMHDARIGTV